jgi:hypothetical protein
MRWIWSIVLLSSCCAAPAPGSTADPVWIGSTPEISAALQDAAALLCDAGACVDWTEDPSLATHTVQIEDIPYCGVARSDTIAISHRPGTCVHFVPEPAPEIGQRLLVPPVTLGGQWRIATDHESLTLIIAHELGHTLGWQHETTPGALMQPEAGFRSIPLTLPTHVVP